MEYRNSREFPNGNSRWPWLPVTAFIQHLFFAKIGKLDYVVDRCRPIPACMQFVIAITLWVWALLSIIFELIQLNRLYLLEVLI